VYAIVKTGGKQYRVERGQYLLVERLPEEVGASVALQPLMYRSEEAVFDAKGLEQVHVTAKILAHERGEKLRVVKFKPKRGYKRRTGHRQELTRIEITEIGLGAAKAAAGKAAKPAAASHHESAAPKSHTEPAASGTSETPTESAAKPARARKPAKPAAAAKEASEDGA
jgi:large subunit ribosomal protein L21